MTFAQPIWLLLIPFLLFSFWHFGKKAKTASGQAAMRLSQAPEGPRTWRARIRRALPWLRPAALILLAVAMARPQRKWQEEKIKADAVDIMLAMDISPSMLSRDFDPDRLAVAKTVAIHFVDKRPYDRLGLTAFSAEAFTQCPLTTDRRVIQEFIKNLQVGRLEDGTAIGMGLATAVNRLKDSASKSKLVILLTDGENNAGYIDPMQAAEIAHTLGIRVYTVGIGTEGVVMSPAQRNPDGSYIYAPREMMFDTQLLEEIARATGGKFYRAYSEDDLEGIYAEIDKLEKTRIEVTTIQRTKDFFQWLLAVAAAFLLLELLGRWGILRSILP